MRLQCTRAINLVVNYVFCCYCLCLQQDPVSEQLLIDEKQLFKRLTNTEISPSVSQCCYPYNFPVSVGGGKIPNAHIMENDRIITRLINYLYDRDLVAIPKHKLSL